MVRSDLFSSPSACLLSQWFLVFVDFIRRCDVCISVSLRSFEFHSVRAVDLSMGSELLPPYKVTDAGLIMAIQSGLTCSRLF